MPRCEENGKPETLKQMQNMGCDPFFTAYRKQPRWNALAAQHHDRDHDSGDFQEKESQKGARRMALAHGEHGLSPCFQHRSLRIGRGNCVLIAQGKHRKSPIGR